jgi:hypothetical protein
MILFFSFVSKSKYIRKLNIFFSVISSGIALNIFIYENDIYRVFDQNYIGK